MPQIQIQESYTRRLSDDYQIKFLAASISVNDENKLRAIVSFSIIDTETSNEVDTIAYEVVPNEWNAFWAAVKNNGMKALFQTLKVKMPDVIPGAVGTVEEEN